MIKYGRRIAQAMKPERPSEAIAIILFAPLLTYLLYMGLIKDLPSVQVYSETSWPPQVHQNETLRLDFDIAFAESCTVTAKRILRTPDDIDYVVSEDIREVVAGVRTQNTVNVPITTAIPIGPATVRGEFSFACDWWSRYVKARTRVGVERPVDVLPALTHHNNSYKAPLPPRDGFTIVRAHYRKLPAD